MTRTAPYFVRFKVPSRRLTDSFSRKEDERRPRLPGHPHRSSRRTHPTHPSGNFTDVKPSLFRGQDGVTDGWFGRGVAGSRWVRDSQGRQSTTGSPFRSSQWRHRGHGPGYGPSHRIQFLTQTRTPSGRSQGKGHVGHATDWSPSTPQSRLPSDRKVVAEGPARN